MQDARTFDFALDHSIDVDRNAQLVIDKLQRQIGDICHRVRRMLTVASFPDFYAGAFERTNASVPVVSFRGIERGR